VRIDSVNNGRGSKKKKEEKGRKVWLDLCWIAEILLFGCYSTADLADVLGILHYAPDFVYVVCVCPNLAEVLLVSDMG
jgi:hypothetical protein